MNKLLPKTFLWMFIGLMVTFVTGYFVSNNMNMLQAIYEGPWFWIILIVEFALVIFFSARIHKMKPTTARICFLLYSFVSGLTFSSVFVYFKLGSVMFIFLIAALVFAIFGAIGYFTNLDLSKLRTVLLMGLVAVVICTIINIFVGSSSFDLIVSIIALLVFFGFTAYDVYTMKILSNSGMNEDVTSIYGAFELYLDFINIFLHLLQIIGDAKN